MLADIQTQQLALVMGGAVIVFAGVSVRLRKQDAPCRCTGLPLFDTGEPGKILLRAVCLLALALVITVSGERSNITQNPLYLDLALMGLLAIVLRPSLQKARSYGRRSSIRLPIVTNGSSEP